MQTTQENLGTVLAQLARRTPDGRLVSVLAIGLVTAVVAIVIEPPAWFQLLAAGVCLLAFGAWGISDRVLLEDAGAGTSKHRLVRATRIAALVLGVCGGVALLLGVFALMVGNWIS